MLDQLINTDQQLFYAINNGLSNPFFDWLMPLLRNRFFWAPLYLFLALFLVLNYKRTGLIILIFFGLTFGLTDYFASSLVKPAVQRLRPCNDTEVKSTAKMLIACGTGYSFPSTHAANHFALAIFLIAVFYKRWKPIMILALLWAFAVSFAQIYVGVHYPLDILGGAVLGSMIGYVTGTILLTLKPQGTWKPGN